MTKQRMWVPDISLHDSIAENSIKLNVSQWINFNAAGNDPATRW